MLKNNNLKKNRKYNNIRAYLGNNQKKREIRFLEREKREIGREKRREGEILVR